MVLNSKNGIKNHHRCSIRLPGYDYARAGAYFVTMVTYGRECLFGEIIDGEMRLNKFGLLVESEWRSLEKRFRHVVVGDFIVMPNHGHDDHFNYGTPFRKTVGALRFQRGCGGIQIRCRHAA